MSRSFPEVPVHRVRSSLLALCVLVALPLAACTSDGAASDPTATPEPTAIATTPVEIPGPQDREMTRAMFSEGQVAQGQAELLEAGTPFRVAAACLSADGSGMGSVTILVDGVRSTAKEMPCNGAEVSIQMLGKAQDATVQLSLSVPEGDVTAYAVGTAE